MDAGSRKRGGEDANREPETHLDFAVRIVRAAHVPPDALRRALARARHPDRALCCWFRWLLDGGAASN
jgi:hypothetical protein